MREPTTTLSIGNVSSPTRSPLTWSSVTTTSVTGPATTRMPRAWRRPDSSAVGPSPAWTKSVTVSESWRNSIAWCTAIGRLRDHADRGVAHLPPVAVGAMDTSMPERARRFGMSGSSSVTPVATRRRRADRVVPSSSCTSNIPSSRRCAPVAAACTNSTPYPATSARPFSGTPAAEVRRGRARRACARRLRCEAGRHRSRRPSVATDRVRATRSDQRRRLPRR